MATIHFWEKPGCAGNARQKLALAASGHTVLAHDLRAEPWTKSRLRPFFGGRPVAEWFNRTSPRVKSGEITPELLDEDAALALMLADPLLIRRPLMQVGDERACGFEPDKVAAWVGLRDEARAPEETCQKPAGVGCAVP